MSAGLTWILPVHEGELPALRAALAELGEGEASPFARVPGVHVGRLVVLERLEDPRGGRAAGPFLLVGVDADPPAGSVVAALATHLAGVLRACEGCPDPRGGDRFDRWLARHRAPDGFSIRPYPTATVGDVRAALALRRRLGDFAVRADGLEAAELRGAFLEEFR